MTLKKHIGVRKLLLGTLLLLSGAAHSQVWSVPQMLSSVQTSGVVLKAKDGSVLEIIQRSWASEIVSVTDKIAPTYGISAPRLFIVKQSGPNAFVTLDHGEPIMVVNTDMLRIVGDDQDLMAAVIGHELGHLKAGHLTQGRSLQQFVSIMGVIAGAAIDIREARHGTNTGGLATRVGAVGADLVNAKFTRDQEREADDLGIRHMAEAGYDPKAAVRLWALMEQQGGGGNGLWLNSHPSSAERYETMSKVAASLGTVYVANRLAEKALPKYEDTFPPGRFTSYDPTLAELSEEPLGVYARARAEFKLGHFKEAYPLYQEAAEGGDERAIAALGTYEQTGKLGPADYGKAHELYLQAANKGFSTAIMSLGLEAFLGKGAPQDPVEAARLLGIADARHDARATALLALMYLDSKPFPRDPVLARQLAERSADNGEAMGRAVLGMMLREGIGGARDLGRSFALLSLSTTDSAINTYPLFQLGLSYETGAGTGVDKDKAIALYRQAFSYGYAPAGKRLQAMGVAVDPAPAVATAASNSAP